MDTTRLSMRSRLIVAACCFLLAAGWALAEENGSTVTGAALYHTHCASCHGDQGRGDGMVGAALRTPPADLTAIARKNGGIFPDGMIIEFIDGTRDVVAHGPRAMPVWGMVFQNREIIRKIVDYLRDLQRP
ncbi:MAG: cytochrome c [Deltaproteobacteria bacterium]|nr:cytochrome c [Deltaproteobacteria bacterium]